MDPLQKACRFVVLESSATSNSAYIWGVFQLSLTLSHACQVSTLKCTHFADRRGSTVPVGISAPSMQCRATSGYPLYSFSYMQTEISERTKEVEVEYKEQKKQCVLV